MSAPRFHGLLIGVDLYGPPGGPPPSPYSNLEGAVLDVLRWTELLQGRGIPREDLRVLTAPREGGAAEDLPTYERIVDALGELERRAQGGDEVFFAFSGHGGRVPTLLPEVKGEDGIDEALIPAEAWKSQSQVLRDVELAAILRRWVDRGLQVTLCFDCCHAGGTARGPRARGSGLLDGAPRPCLSRLFSREELEEVWRQQSRRLRDLIPASGWLPNPQGYVLFAACQAHEQAFEGRFDALGSGGAMTHALLQALRAAPPGITCFQLHRQIRERLRHWVEGQNPQLEGEWDRPFWPGEAPDSHSGPDREGLVSELFAQGDPGHYLQGQLSLQVFDTPETFDPRQADLAMLRRFVAEEGSARDTAQDGEWICLKVQNRSLQPLFFALYSVLAVGGIQRFYPLEGVGDSESLLPGAWDLIPVRPRLTGGDLKATETFLALAANDRRLFRGEPGAGIFWTVEKLAIVVEPW